MLGWLTDGADDASVASLGRGGVNVQQTQVLQEGVSHGSVQLLGLDEGGTHIFTLSLGHDWISVCWSTPATDRRERGRFDSVDVSV